jgi:hypothetical protein
VGLSRESLILNMEKSTPFEELTTLLESRITNFYTNFQVDEASRAGFCVVDWLGMFLFLKAS